MIRRDVQSLKKTAVAAFRSAVPVQRRSIAADASLVVPFASGSVDPIPLDMRIAVVCHLFHTDLCGLSLDAVSNIDYPTDLLISTHAARRAMCPHYVAGLIGLGERKSMQPMAARQDGLSYDRLQHFISVRRWDDAPLARGLLTEADRMVGGRDAVLVVNDMSLPKKGRHSVGVAPRYLSTQGKTGNCQAMVSPTLARREVPVLLGLRLFLPTTWTDDAARMARAGVPETAQAPRTKPEIRWTRWTASGPRATAAARRSGRD